VTLVLSEQAEASTISANRALAHFRLLTQTSPVRRSRILDSGQTDAGAIRFHTHDAILRLVAIAEGFSISKLVETTERKLPADRIVELLWDSEFERSGDTWDSRYRLWERLHEIPRGDFDDRDALDGFIAARNSIVHGLGELTRQQLRGRKKTVSRLGHARIKVMADERLDIDSTHVEQCAVVVKHFIAWLDNAATSR
jgi:hypothetical protein